MRFLMVVPAVLLVSTLAAFSPQNASAACGGGGLETYLAKRVGRHADTIILGRLIRIDEDRAHHYKLLEVFRGEAPASPIRDTWDPALPASGMIDVGGCTNQQVERGGLFVYAEGDQAARFGKLQIIFPKIRDGQWLIGHFGSRSTLDELLVLLGVLPPTSTVEPVASSGADSRNQSWWAMIGGATLVAWFALWLRDRKRRSAAPLL